MRALIVGLVVTGAIAVVWLWLRYNDRDQRRRSTRDLAAPGEQEARRMLLHTVRLLDRALADPMVRQSSEWENEATALVEAYYGKELGR